MTITSSIIPGLSTQEMVAVFLANMSNMPGAALYEHGWRGSSWILLDPVLSIESHHQGSIISTARGETFDERDPLEVLTKHALAHLLEDSPIPLCAGYASYELAHTLEKFPVAASDTIGLPHAMWFLYGKVLELRGEQVIEHRIKWEQLEPIWTASGKFTTQRLSPDPNISGYDPAALLEDLSANSNFTRTEYQEAVCRIIDFIRAGDVYQVNFTQKFSLPLEHYAAEYYQTLREINPTARGGFLQLPGQRPRTIVSSSPELFVQSTNGKLLTSPIKGTRPRGISPEQDKQFQHQLLSSEKDRAELAMIVDLMRNDLSRVARIPSVKVEQHARLETLANVHHLVSDVSAQLAPELGCAEVLRALFPCGSITGCPKIAAMEIISELEGTARGVYTGTLGLIWGSRDFEFNVAIRTAVVQDARLTFQAGGGVVLDSDPEAEYWESLHKAQSLYQAWCALEKKEREKREDASGSGEIAASLRSSQ
jgi:para-aminobenzoate synthetase component 1